MHFRYARATNKLSQLSDFYSKIFNLELLGSFKNHDNYDGIFLGNKGENWHLEFTQCLDLSKSIFDEDDHLVFYPNNLIEYDAIIKNLKVLNIEIKITKNPYWRKNGIYFKDPDGFGIIISKPKNKTI